MAGISESQIEGRGPKSPGIGAALLTGLMLSASAASILYAGWRIFALPFVPFDLFDWTTRILPGALLTAGIDLTVALIRGLRLGATATTAKLAEQAMAVAQFVIAGIVVATAYFYLARLWPRRSDVGFGAIAGVVIGAMVLPASLWVGHSALAGEFISGVWVMAVFVAWGATCGWTYHRVAATQSGTVAEAVWARSGGEVAMAAAQSSGTAEAVANLPEPPVGADDYGVVPLDRRHFLIRLGGATAVITLGGAVVGRLAQGPVSHRMATALQSSDGRWSATHALPNAGASLAPAPGTRPEFTPLEDHYRIDINTAPPVIDGTTWRLNVTGLVDPPGAFTLDQLRRYEPMHQFVTLSCISNPVGGDLIGTTRWTGLSLQRLLPDLHLKPEATHLKISAADEFYEILDLETARNDPRVMLAYAWDGLPLTADHGFPLRIYIPDRHGMKQPKWIESIEATDHWEEGYWVTRGWDKDAHMKATSVIDTIAVDMMIGEAGRDTLIPVGGIAHAGARGISKVEVRVDDGEWREAKLRTPLSDLTWVIWRYDWPFEKGKHALTVRCFDGKGATQIVEEAPPHPSGASGLHSKTIML